MLPNLPQMVIAFYSALKLGAIVVNTNPVHLARSSSSLRMPVRKPSCC